jgi:predicted PurR-regulated permease PerM
MIPMQLDKFTTRKWISLLLLIVFGLLLLFLLSGFITSFLGAIIFYILFKPMMRNLTQKRGWKDVWAATLIILISFVIILIPVFTLSYLLYEKVAEVLNSHDSLFNSLRMLDAQMQSTFGVEVFTEKNLDSIKESAGKLIPSFLNQFIWTLGNIGIMYFILYYLLVQETEIIAEVKKMLPFNAESTTMLAEELEAMTLSNIIGVPAIGIIQGTAAGLGYWMFGLQEPIFWGVITSFVSLLPLIGSTLIWVPAGLFLIAMGQTWPGIGLLIYGIIIIINIDNVARFIIQKRFADVHPIITVFGVIIGLDIFGLPGLVFGPLMISYFVILIRMYRKFYEQQNEPQLE